VFVGTCSKGIGREPMKSEGWIEKRGKLWVVTDAGRKAAEKESSGARA